MKQSAVVNGIPSSGPLLSRERRGHKQCEGVYASVASLLGMSHALSLRSCSVYALPYPLDPLSQDALLPSTLPLTAEFPRHSIP